MNTIEELEAYRKQVRENFELKINLDELCKLHYNDDLHVIIVHQYLIRKVYFNCSYEVEATLRELEAKTNVSFAKVRHAINKLEDMGIIKIVRGGGRTPNTFIYIQE